MKKHLRDIAVFLGIAVLFIIGFYAAGEPDAPSQVPVSAGYIIATSTDVQLSIGQTGKVGDLEITFNSLEQDSRCPIDVQCIEAGAVNTNVTFARGGERETKNMPSDEVPQLWGGYAISIVEISPPRLSTSEIDPTSYEVTFRAVQK